MSKMNVIFVTVPSYGHLHPLIPLGMALEAQGHSVFVATTSNFLPAVAATGLRGLSLGPAEDPARPGISLNRPAIIDTLVTLAEDLQPDVIIHDHLAVGAGLAADLIGIPNAYLSVGIMRPPHSMNLVRQLGEPLWRHYRLPLPPAFGLYRHLYLDRCPPSLQPPEIRDIPKVHPISPLSYDGSSTNGTLPDWAARLGSKPVIYVTLGTWFKSMKSFADILNALKGEAAEIIVTVGRDMDPAELGPQPDNVHIERYIPQSLILPYCDLVIAHGGSGTMLASLAQGLPLVILPQNPITDQSWNGEHCVARGAGLMLKSEQATPEAIRAAVRAVQTDPAYRRNAQEVAAEIAALPGLDHAVDLLEALVATYKPSRQPEAALMLAERRSR